MRNRLLLLLAISYLPFAIWGCEKLPFLKTKKEKERKEEIQLLPVKGTVIAKIGNVSITLEDLNEAAEAYNTLVPADRPEAKIDTKEEKINHLRNALIPEVLFYQEALNRGLDKKESLLRNMEKIRMRLLAAELLNEEFAKVEVSSKEIEDLYNRFKEEFKEPEERQIREIVVSTEEEAKNILIELLKGADFSSLARQYSKAQSREKAGDLGFIKRGSKGIPSFDDVAFSPSLEAGKISNIFKGPDGFYILKLEAKREGRQVSLSEAWDNLKANLLFLKQEQKRDQLISELTRQAKIEIYEGQIK